MALKKKFLSKHVANHKISLSFFTVVKVYRQNN